MHYRRVERHRTTQNQLNGIGMLYDSAGNVTKDNLGNTPTYDDENRIATVAGYTYSYDAEGARMEKANGSSGTMYWPGRSGEVLTESDLTGTINEEFVYFDGQRIARVDRPSGTVHYYFSNHLGSHTMVTSATGSCEQDIDYFPYGGEITDHCPNVAQHYKFTGKERDAESGLDNFGARYNASSLGRFMTPDWAARPTSVPYAVFGDPQSLNLYGYVRNDPVTQADADGHEPLVPMGPLEDNSGTTYEEERAQTLTGKEEKQAQNTCQSGNCNVKVVSDTGPTGTTDPFTGTVRREVTYQAVDSSDKPVKGAEISLHETPLPGKEGGDSKNYTYASGKGSSNSQKGEESAHRAGQLTDVMSTGGRGSAGFRQTYTVEGKSADIIWPTKNGPVEAPSQKVLIGPALVVIKPEVSQ